MQASPSSPHSLAPAQRSPQSSGHRTTDSQQLRDQLRDQVKKIESSRFETHTPVNKKDDQRTNTEQDDTAQENIPQENTRLANVNVALSDLSPTNWIHVYRGLNVKGIVLSTASNCALVAVEKTELHFVLDRDKGSLFDESQVERLASSLSEYFSEKVTVSIRLGEIAQPAETPAQITDREYRERYSNALIRLKQDSIVQTFQSEFDASLDEDSIVFTD